MPERTAPEVNLKKSGDSSSAAFCQVAWQRFNVRVGLICVLASNVSGVTVETSADDGRRQRGGMASHLDPPFPGPSAGALTAPQVGDPKRLAGIKNSVVRSPFGEKSPSIEKLA